MLTLFSVHYILSLLDKLHAIVFNYHTNIVTDIVSMCVCLLLLAAVTKPISLKF